MEADKLENLKVMGLKALTDADEDGKAEYEKKFTLTYERGEREHNDEFITSLCEAMYDDFVELVKNQDPDVDFVGIQVTYDGKKEENAIKLSTLESMKKYGEGKLFPLYEFLAMTVNK